METWVTFSLRIPEDLAHSVADEAKREGLSKSEYARRAMEEFNRQQMQKRMARLSVRLATHSAAAAQAMDAGVSDGLP